MNFVQPIPALNLYFAQKSDGSTSSTIAYLSNSSPNSFTLDTAWADKGCFIFLREAAFDWTAFYTYLTDTLNVLKNNTRIVWANSLDQYDISKWQYTSLQAGNQTGSTAVINNSLSLLYRNYGICVGAGCTLSLNDQLPGFNIIPGGTSVIGFTANSGTSNAGTITAVSIQANEDDGVLQFQMSFTVSEFGQLNAGICYFYPDATTVGKIDVLSFPVFNIQNNVALFGNLDPCKNDGQSGFSILLSDPSLTTPQVLASNFVTNTGYSVSLQATQNSGLALAVQPSTTTPSAADPYYLVPTGNFILTSDSPVNSALQLMPGLCGVEFIQTDASQLPALEFIPGCNAYAPDFPNVTATETTRLSAIATTAWGYVHGGGIGYLAQPEHSVLHANTNQDNFLQSIYPPAGILPSSDSYSGTAPLQFPLAPYAGIDADTILLAEDFEKKIMSLERRSQIYTINKENGKGNTLPSQGAKVQSSTPGGLHVILDNSLNNWESLMLGKDEAQNKLCLYNVTGALKAAFQTANQFIVISDPSVLSGVFLGNQCVMSGWNFNLDPSVWTNHNTIVILKYYPGKSISDLNSNTALWQHPNDFNSNDPASVQSTISTIITQAGSIATAPSYLQYFISVINDPDWNGVLFLNADVPLNALPTQLEGIAAGIDPSLFYAHHIGLSLSPVKTSKMGDLIINPSAFFGLINYTAPGNPDSYSNSDYDFQVNTLQVEFINSQITYFNSQIQITLNKLFGEYCHSQNNNNIVLNGVYQDHNGKATYQFTSNGDTSFTMNSPTLNTIDISGAQFVTIQSLGGWGNNSQVHTRFVFSGSICFQKLNQVDLFSYSNLAFDGLWLDMAFNISNPYNSRTFQFDPSDISLGNPAPSDCRAGSFVTQFPLKLQGLVFNPGKGSNTGKDFLAVAMPSSFSGADGSFYALVYDLPMGSMGALAPQTSFTAQIMLCWTPQENYNSAQQGQSYPAELKIKLPFGGGGKNFLSIEGIINLGIEGIQLYADSNEVCTIKLRDFGLSILSITLPPSGTTDIYLFGNPGSGSDALGWYASYSKQTSYAQDPYNS